MAYKTLLLHCNYPNAFTKFLAPLSKLPPILTRI